MPARKRKGSEVADEKIGDVVVQTPPKEPNVQTSSPTPRKKVTPIKKVKPFKIKINDQDKKPKVETVSKWKRKRPNKEDEGVIDV